MSTLEVTTEDEIGKLSSQSSSTDDGFQLNNRQLAQPPSPSWTVAKSISTRLDPEGEEGYSQYAANRVNSTPTLMFLMLSIDRLHAF